MRFEEKIALITGGGSGIGLATVKRLLSEGAKVAVLNRDKSAWDRIKNMVDPTGKRALFFKVDVTRQDEITQVIREVKETFGHIDILINNAGAPKAESFEDTDIENWQQDLELNLTSYYRMVKSLLPHLYERGEGVIVNVSSINALMSFGNPAYSAAKAGILALTRSLAIEYAGEGLRVNSVLPGSVQTEAWDFRIAKRPEAFEKVCSWYPAGAVGKPEEIAAAICFLASSDASFINGVALVVDGGVTAGNHKMIADIIGE